MLPNVIADSVEGPAMQISRKRIYGWMPACAGATSQQYRESSGAHSLHSQGI
jgi:hypothetical protein